MKLNIRPSLAAGVVLIIALSLAVVSACAVDEIASEGSPVLSEPDQTSIKTVTPTPSATPVLYPEPSVRPPLPSEVKWNPYRGEWYDSSEIEPDPVTHEYKNVPHTLPPGYTPPRGPSITEEEWIVQHQNSTDEVDIAIIKYRQALDEYIKKWKEEDPYWMARSWVPVGAEEGGPLTILTDLGIPNLQKLLDYAQWENPFTYYLEAAIARICRRTITGGLGSSDSQVNLWRKDFNDQASSAKSQVDDIARKLANKQPNEQDIRITFERLGIFALPEVYELVNNQGNTDLIQYLPDILPLDKMKAYNIQAGQTDDATLKQALESCPGDIAIIQTLHAD